MLHVGRRLMGLTGRKFGKGENHEKTIRDAIMAAVQKVPETKFEKKKKKKKPSKQTNIKDLSEFGSSPRTPLSRASTLRRIFSLNKEIFKGTDPLFMNMMEFYNWVQMIVYHRPQGSFPPIWHSLLLFVTTLIVWLLFNHFDSSLLVLKEENKPLAAALRGELEALGKQIDFFFNTSITRNLEFSQGLSTRGKKSDLVERLRNHGKTVEPRKEDLEQKNLGFHSFVRHLPEQHLSEKTLFPYVSVEERGEQSLTVDTLFEQNRSNNKGNCFKNVREYEGLQRTNGEAKCERDTKFVKSPIPQLEVLACFFQNPKFRNPWNELMSKLAEIGEFKGLYNITEQSVTFSWGTHPSVRTLCFCGHH